MQDLGDFINMETMQFVNPYEVNPILETITAEQPQQVSVNQDYLTLKDELATNKLKMEEFSDLSTILSVENLDLTGSVDELSTPVFDKGAFDFCATNSAKTASTPTTNLKVKVELNAQYYPCGLLANDKNNETFSVSTASLDDDYAQIISYNKPLNNPTPFASNLSLSSNNIKKSNSTATSPQDDRYSYVSSPDQQMDLEVPQQYYYDYNPNNLKLNLMTEEFKYPFKEEGLSTLNTPDVIDGVVNMGNEFNILDLVNNEDITILSADEEFLSALTSPTTTAFSSEPPTPIPAKKSRRRKHSTSDDDEDYVPPSKKSSTVRFSDIDIEQSSSSDDYLPPTKNTKPRGRPRKVSASRQDSKSTYRELRDKNNEASRKSRQKRREKEKKYEKEADELHVKNIKLKAQVEELEKMVSSFRNNLFKILVSK
ncbi:unnamed protein product [Ceutorhynchus assimilis]|uniref:BZIP domain-containing protein n=1 Tax=Ceutorhynchus assimilis TaxID=467358 RepID=A0A9N9ML02_9CUCU|nr:unnamed protein product [Ceutorhynchus assimilis]